MRPLQAHCHYGLGTLYAKRGRQEQARAELSTTFAGKRLPTPGVRFGLTQVLGFELLLAYGVGDELPLRGVLQLAALGKTSPMPARHTGIGPRALRGLCGFLRQ